MVTRRKFIKTASLFGLAMMLTPQLFAGRRTKSAKTKSRYGKVTLKKGDCILFYGDSITDGNRNKEMKVFSHPNAMGGGYAMSTSSTLACENPQMEFKFWNRGINGNKTEQMINRLQEDCLGLKHKPTVVSLLTGINDYSLAYLKTGKGDVAKYENDLRELLRRITEGLPGVRMIVMEPYAIAGIREKTDSFLPGFYEYQPIAKKVAAEFGAVFIPLQSIFDDAIRLYGKETFSRDGVHPWSAGIELISQAWLDAVEIEN